MSDYCHLNGFPKSISADHGSCFTSFDFRNFCEKNNNNLILYTVGDHRFNGVAERLIYTIKETLLAMPFNKPKRTLNAAIDKIISNIRSTRPLSNPFSQGVNWFGKTVNSRQGELYFKRLAGKPLLDTTHTVTLDNGHVLRKSELDFKKI